MDLVDYMKNKYGEENVLKEICPNCSKKFTRFSAGIYEDESGMIQYHATTVMLVTCALKRRNGTRNKRNIFNGTFNDN